MLEEHNQGPWCMHPRATHEASSHELALLDQINNKPSLRVRAPS